MRVLLDACVPKKLRQSLPGHEARTASEIGWADLDSGDLLDAMERRFEALVTTDKGMPHQQRIRRRSFGVVVLRARTNRLEDLLPLVPSIATALDSLRPGDIREVAG